MSLRASAHTGMAISWISHTPHNALTGAPGTPYLSKVLLRDHLRLLQSVPPPTFRGSLTGALRLTLLFFAFIGIPAIIA